MQYRISRSALVALIERWEGDLPAPKRHDVALRLGASLGALDAVRLDAALRAIQSQSQCAPANGQALDWALLQERYEQGMQALRTMLETPPAPAATARGRSSAAAAKTTITAAAAAAAAALPHAASTFAPQHKRYLHTQKQMAHQVAALRERIRQTVAAGTQTLRQLAALDAVMEPLWAAQEARWWAELVHFLERRWRFRLSSAQALPELGMRAFDQDLHDLLRAELELRLMPLHGLMEAAREAR